MRRIAAWAGASCVLLAFLCAFHSLFDPDIWFHLRGGSLVAAGQIPRVDTYSYPSAGNSYIDLHWLFQLLVFTVHRVGGEPALVWLAALIAAGTFWILYRLARRHAAAPLAGAIVSLGVIVASERFSPRPELLSFLFLALALWLVRRHEEGWRPAVWLLPLLVLVWVNTEGLFVLAFGVLAAALLDRPRDRRLWMAAGLCAIASLINPYFVEGALHPLVLFTRVNRSLPVYSATIGEFLSPFGRDTRHPAVALFPFYLGLVAVSALGLALTGNLRRLRRGDLLLLAAFVYLSVSARRNIALLPLAATPILVRWLSLAAASIPVRRFWAGRSPSVRSSLATAAVAVLCLAPIIYTWALATNRIYIAAETNRRFGTGRAPADFTRGAMAFLNEQDLEGPVFATFAAGSYMTWASPQHKVFIDGRLEVHDATHYERYLRMLGGGTHWNVADEQYKFNVAIIQYLQATGLAMERLQDPAWAFVHLDETAVVLVRRAERNQETIARHGIDPARLYETYPRINPDEVGASFPLPPRPPAATRLLGARVFPWKELNLGQFFLMIRRLDLALAQFEAAVRLAPGAAEPRIMVAAALNMMGKPQAAFEVIEGAAPMATSSSLQARLAPVRGDVLVGLNRLPEAVQAYDLSLRVGHEPGQRASVLASRGLARLRLGDPGGAAADLQASLQINRSDPQAWRYLGMAEEARGNRDAARVAYEAFRALGGRAPEVDEALRRLLGQP